ncbi:MAG: GNAT family N-acetyltransferase, partial [Planktotalea sp.]|uniref:GNAT family N-acetyltransferase n=1 Tax=Planktotalea sp. TaxID=2029877 RepID=UPI003C77BB83
MKITVRAVEDRDIPLMTSLLNEIIKVGGTTAYLSPISEEDMKGWITRSDGLSSWIVALDEADAVLGFQWAEPYPQLPPEAASIATFVDVGAVGGGIGTKLFDQTCANARALGFSWINASIRSDNDSGLSYYSKMGFADWKVEPDAKLSDGRVTGK